MAPSRDSSTAGKPETSIFSRAAAPPEIPSAARTSSRITSAAGSRIRMMAFQLIQSLTGVRSTHQAAWAAFFPSRVPQREQISPASTSRAHFLQ